MATRGKTGVDTPVPIDLQTMEITIRGTAPLIMHKWSEKAKAAMRAKQQKSEVKTREARDPEQECRDALIVNDDGQPSLLAIAVKSAVVTAATSTSMTKVAIRQAFRIHGQFIPIDGDWTMVEDMTRTSTGVADLRYRPYFYEWTAVIPVIYNRFAISAEQLQGLFALAGFGVGVGDWRPEKNGDKGTWEVVSVTATST